ncbi:peroxiredoxin family protein [Bacteroides sp. AN502(2024)]|uniref:peroxiredoxin family protein n=1 Tax=Bacteroides sp. AN502(2024) TaxID=3160599 RepID=UPI003510E4D9
MNKQHTLPALFLLSALLSALCGCRGKDADPTRPTAVVCHRATRLPNRPPLVGKKAPRLSRTDPSVPGGVTLLVFYRTDCETCESVLRDLRGFYPTLQERNVRIVSISCDKDQSVFSSRAAAFPWATKWHDSRGFYSPDFEAYGVTVTPTLVLVNPDGRVAGSYGTLKETGLLRSFY